MSNYLVENPKTKFLVEWILVGVVVISLSYVASLLVVLFVHGVFGFSQTEGGTYLSQTLMQIAGGAVIGMGVAIYQKSLLQRMFNVSQSWIYASVAGFAIGELFVCIILWQLNLNRDELRFIENNPLPEVLIFALIGMVTGALQWRILKNYFKRSFYWVLASALGWSICILWTVFSVWAFFAGTLFYGFITGATMVWLLKPKNENK